MKPYPMILSLVILTICSTVGLTQESSKPWWNPFAKDESSTATGVRKSNFFNGSGSESKKPMFQLPKMPWTSSAKNASGAIPRRRGPSMLSRMGSTTRRWWDNTIDFVNPFDSPKSTLGRGYQPQNLNTPYAKKKTSSGKGPFGWLWREEQIERPTSVPDWLKQPRPRF